MKDWLSRGYGDLRELAQLVVGEALRPAVEELADFSGLAVVDFFGVGRLEDGHDFLGVSRSAVFGRCVSGLPGLACV